MKYVAYYRVSTQKQGKSGLGLDAQKKMVTDFVAMNGGEIVSEYTEIESGKSSERPQLLQAMEACFPCWWAASGWQARQAQS